MRHALIAAFIFFRVAVANDVAVTIDASSKLWSSDVAVVDLTVVSRDPRSVHAALHLVNANGDEYWSPFDLISGVAARTNDLTPLPRGRIRVRLHADRLPWAAARSALWPSRRFAVTVPPGPYRLTIRITAGRRSWSSNALDIAVR